MSCSHRLFVAIAFHIFLIGCSGPQSGSSGPSLKQAVTMYNDMLRWGTPMGALEYVVEEERDLFVKAIQKDTARARVLEAEIQAVRVGENGDSAEVFVSFLWVPGDSITTVASVQRQTWKRTETDWRVHRAEPMGEGPTLFTW